MKKFIYATVLLITITSCSVFAQVTWDDFDSPGIINYSYFDGVGFNQEFTNPSTGGINSSAVCASYDRNSGTEYDVIVIQPSGTAIIDTITDYVSGTKKMSLKVFSPEAGKKVQITLEDNTVAGPTNYPSGRHSEYTATTTTSNEWETLTFTLVNQPDASVSDGAINQMVVLFDPGTFNSDNYLFDDLMGPELYNPCEGVVTEPSIIDDFECQRNLNYSFANGTFTVESNPVKTGVNTSETCGKFRKFTPPLNDGAFGGDLATFFNTSQFKYAHIDLYDPAAPQDLMMIFQDGSGVNLIEKTLTTNSTSSWESFVVDISAINSATSIEKVVLLVNVTSATEDTLYFDNFSLSYDGTVSIADIGSSSNIAVFPNPTKDLLTIESSESISSVRLFDLTGKLLLFEDQKQDVFASLNVENLTKGIYLLEVATANGDLTKQKVIKQ